MADGSTLAWVIVDGVPRRVSEFAHLPPGKRPRASCPECDRPLTLKLGRVRIHHAAHAPGEVCGATQPETALHLACKFALAEQLRSCAGADAVLRIRQRCAGGPEGGECERVDEREWLREWDEVSVERRLDGGLRPDILLRRAGRDLGGIELLVTHAVSPEKVARLAERSVPWIEVGATERLASAGGWTTAEPLPVLRAGLEEPWRCAPHRLEHDRARAERARRVAAEQEARRHATVLEAARVVDVYHEDGLREREIYRVETQRTDGRVHRVRLMRGGLEIAARALAEDEGWQAAAWTQLRAAFAADVRHRARDGHSIVDSPMRWAVGMAAENLVDEALADRVGRDPTPLVSRYPRRWFFAAERGEWFLPADMRDVRWDRPEADAFAAHPAWTRARAAVRERPAPEDSWETPVFASRPVAAAFVGGTARGALVRRAGGQGDPIAIVAVGADARPPRQALVVVERRAPDEAIARTAAELSRDGVEQLWMSHPLDWSPSLGDLAWAPAGRDARGRTLVLVDGVGIFRADQFCRAVAGGDRRLAPEALRARLADRVRVLATKARAR